MKVINWDSNTIIRVQLWDIAGELTVCQSVILVADETGVVKWIESSDIAICHLLMKGGFSKHEAEKLNKT